MRRTSVRVDLVCTYLIHKSFVEEEEGERAGGGGGGGIEGIWVFPRREAILWEY